MKEFCKEINNSKSIPKKFLDEYFDIRYNRKLPRVPTDPCLILVMFAILDVSVCTTSNEGAGGGGGGILWQMNLEDATIQ